MKTHVHASSDISTKLSSALLVYEGHDSAFVTVHAAEVIRRRVTIGPGMPATRSALAELARKLSNATAIAGFIPPQLLYMSPRVISWWRPASPARVFFAPPAHATDDERRIDTRNAVTPQPALVFAVTARDWFVWAADVYAGAPRPAPNVKLLRAPYFNVWRDGRICTGNVKLPQAMTPEVLGEYERAFFDSNFTHPNDPQGLTRHPGGPYAMWRELLDGGRKTFPSTWLPPMKQTLAAAIKTLESDHGR